MYTEFPILEEIVADHTHLWQWMSITAIVSVTQSSQSTLGIGRQPGAVSIQSSIQSISQ